ncbi:hypothetical protein NC652_008896 [Populus alba x Populus x berolinensis]|nr:hypothetical protein NC652_008896 [Populus alba x Populus x berolinensis]
MNDRAAQQRYASLLVFYSHVYSWVFDNGLRRGSHPRIPGLDQTSGIWRMGNMRKQMQRNNGWRGGKECQGNYKNMDGSPDGSKRKVKMDLSAMVVAIGKLESREIGMDVQIFLVNSMKT